MNQDHIYMFILFLKIKKQENYKLEKALIEILKKITDFAEQINLGIKKEHWNSYELMNEKIIRSLDKN